MNSLPFHRLIDSIVSPVESIVSVPSPGVSLPHLLSRFPSACYAEAIQTLMHVVVASFAEGPAALSLSLSLALAILLKIS